MKESNFIWNLELLKKLNKTMYGKKITDIRTATAISKGNSEEDDEPKAIARLISALEDEYTPLRRASAYILGCLKNDNATLPLIKSLKDSDYEVRLKAIKALGIIKNPAAILPLTELINDPEPNIRCEAILALGSIDRCKCLDILKKALNNADETVRLRTAESIKLLNR